MAGILDLQPGHSIREIGADTGYNKARFGPFVLRAAH